MLAEYVGGPVLPSGGVAPAQYLPKRFRQRGYAALMAIASEFESFRLLQEKLVGQRLNIFRAVVFCDRQPGLCTAEPCVLCRIPLHRRAFRIAAESQTRFVFFVRILYAPGRDVHEAPLPPFAETRLVELTRGPDGAWTFSHDIRLEAN